MFSKQALAWKGASRRWWDRFLIQVPPEVERRLSIAKAAQHIATELAVLEPDANREILRQVADLLGLGKEPHGQE